MDVNTKFSKVKLNHPIDLQNKGYKSNIFKQILSLFLVIILFSANTISAQTLFDDDEEEKQDSTENNLLDFNSDNNLLPGSKTFKKFMEHPFAEIHYGMNNSSYKIDNINGFNNDFSPAGTFKIKIGDLNLKTTKADGILKYQSSYFALTHFTTGIGVSESDVNNKINFNAWRISLFADDEGYAYKLGDESYLALYRGSSINWNWLDLDDVYSKNSNDTLNPNIALAKEAMSNFGEQARFGNSFEAGLKAKIAGGVGISATYERSMIFPRVLFFKYAVSSITEGIALSIANSFVKKVLKSSPDYAPIMNFVLKNAISFGFYELTSKNMNWPLNTTAPLIMDSYRIGVTFDM